MPVQRPSGDEDKARELFKSLDKGKTQADFLAAAQELKNLQEATARSVRSVSATAAASSTIWPPNCPDLAAGVSFYGAQPILVEQTAKISARRRCCCIMPQ